MTKHIKPLYITALLDSQPISRILVNNGVVINILHAKMLRKPSKDETCLIPTQAKINNFAGRVSHTKGVIAIELTVGKNT